MHKGTGVMKTWDEMSLFHRQSMLKRNNLRNGEKDGKEQKNKNKKKVYFNFWIAHILHLHCNWSGHCRFPAAGNETNVQSAQSLQARCED